MYADIFLVISGVAILTYVYFDSRDPILKWGLLFLSIRFRCTNYLIMFLMILNLLQRRLAISCSLFYTFNIQNKFKNVKFFLDFFQIFYPFILPDQIHHGDMDDI
jgi:hypothetical protein